LKLNLGRARAPFLVWAYWSILIILTFVFHEVLSAIPWAFTYLGVGRIIGAVAFLDYGFLVLFVMVTSLISFLASRKLKKNGRVSLFALNLIMSLMISSLVTCSFSLIFMPQVSQAGEKIDAFVVENADSSFQDYVTDVSSFLKENIGSAWNKPEAIFRIDNWISRTLLDSYIMRVWGVTRGDVIVYQGWGTCGQSALLIGELLQRAGYETRQAFFKGIDHQWAEVEHNGTWWIVDPWYIGNLVEARDLREINPVFQNASGVEVQYSNGTIVDASHGHGY